MASTSQNPHDIEHVPVLFTPLGELLFYERVNEVSTRSDGKQTKRAIGDAHPKASRWPNHKLAGIAPDPDEGWTRYFYAADRANQHQYNWTLEQEGRLKPRVVQTYVIPRSELVNVVETNLGRTYYLPDTLTGVATASATNLLTKADHGLISQDPLKITDAGASTLTVDAVYFAELMSSSTFKVSATGAYPSDPASMADGTVALKCAASIRPALPGKWYQSTCDVAEAPPELAGLYVVLRVYWEHYSAAADDVLLEYELDGLTGQVMPIQRRKIRVLSAPNAAADMDGNGLYTVVEAIDGEHAWAITRKASSLAGVTAGRTYDSTTSGYTWPMVLGTGTAAQVLAGTHSGIAYYVWNQAVTGGTRIKRIQFFVVPDKPPFSGASKITVQERWSTTKFTISAPAQPQPRRVFWDTGFGVLNVAPCLHGAWSPVPSFTTSSDDVDHPLVTSSMSSFYAQTTTLSDNTTACADWPESFVLSDEQQPYRGGFLRRTVTIFRPYS